MHIYIQTKVYVYIFEIIYLSHIGGEVGILTLVFLKAQATFFNGQKICYKMYQSFSMH